jgi:hypothetical protein
MAVYQTNIVGVDCAVQGVTPTFELSVVSNGPAGTYFQAQLYSGAPGNLVAVGTPTAAIASGNLQWVYATQVAGGTGLSSSLTYWIAAWACGSGGTNPGPASPPAKVVYSPVPLSSVVVSGKRITLQWSYTAATTVTADGIMASISSANGALAPVVQLPLMGFVIGSSPTYACTWSFDVDFPLELAPAPLTLSFYPYTATAASGQISGSPATVTGPVVTQPLFYAAPPVQSAIAGTQAGQYALTIPNVFGSASSVSLTPTVMVNGLPITGAKLSTPVVSSGSVTTTLTLPSATPAGARVDVAVTQNDGATPVISSGPMGPAHTLIMGTPAVGSATFTAPAVAGGQGTLAFTIAYPPSAPPLSAAQVTVMNSAGTAAAGPIIVNGSSGSFKATFTPGSAYNLIVAGAAGSDIGSAAAGVPVLTAPVAVSTLSYDGNVATASWTAPTGTAPAGYRLVVGNGFTAAHVDVTGLSAEVAVPIGGTGLQAAVIPLGQNATVLGPASTGVALLTETLSVDAVTVDPISGKAKVTWTDPITNSGYAIQVYKNGMPSGKPVTSTLASYTFPSAFGAATDVSIAVATTGSVTPGSQTTAVALTGPFGPRRRVPTDAPSILSADFNGTNALVSWTPVPGATGYVVSLVVAGAVAGTPANVAANVTSASVQVPTPIVPASTYQVVVQAQVGPDTGLASALASLFVPGYYLAPASTTAGTAIYPATSLALPMTAALSGLAAASSAMVCYLPSLASGAVTAVTSSGPFSLATNTGSYPFALTIAGGATSEAWTFNGSAFRTQLQADYVTFLKNAEAAGVSPYGISIIQQAIARALPQTFAETLFYAYGFNPTTSATGLLTPGTVDLRPGTILRIAADPYQFVADAPAQAATNGFVGGPMLDFEVASYIKGTNRIAGFDAFIAQLVAGGNLSVDPPVVDPTTWQQPGIADAADLFFPLFCQPFYRLFLPSALADAWGTGSDLPVNNMAIAAATSFTNLCTATNTGQSGGTAAALAYFGGRSVARVCIRVNIRGNDYVVPIGTTVGNALDRFGVRPPSVGVPLTGVALSRSLGGLVTNATGALQVGSRYRVRFDWNSLSIYGFSADALDLPLLHGDVLTF